jgi:hypothetical protein
VCLHPTANYVVQALLAASMTHGQVHTQGSVHSMRKLQRELHTAHMPQLPGLQVTALYTELAPLLHDLLRGRRAGALPRGGCQVLLPTVLCTLRRCGCGAGGRSGQVWVLPEGALRRTGSCSCGRATLDWAARYALQACCCTSCSTPDHTRGDTPLAAEEVVAAALLSLDCCGSAPLGQGEELPPVATLCSSGMH